MFMLCDCVWYAAFGSKEPDNLLIGFEPFWPFDLAVLLFAVTYYAAMLLAVTYYRSGRLETGERNHINAVRCNFGDKSVAFCCAIQYAYLVGVAVGYTIGENVLLCRCRRTKVLRRADTPMAPHNDDGRPHRTGMGTLWMASSACCCARPRSSSGVIGSGVVLERRTVVVQDHEAAGTPFTTIVNGPTRVWHIISFSDVTSKHKIWCTIGGDIGFKIRMETQGTSICTSVRSSSSRGRKRWAGAFKVFLRRCFGASAGDETGGQAIPSVAQPGDILLPPSQQWDWLPIMSRAIINRDGSCVICAAIMCVEAHYRRLHGASSLSFVVTDEAIQALKKKCEVEEAWERVRGADTVEDVLDVLCSSDEPGLPTVHNNIFLRLKTYESFQACTLSTSKIKALIHQKGPLVGVLVHGESYFRSKVYGGCGTSSRDRLHAVACVGYRCVGNELFIIIVDNAECDGPVRYVLFEAFLEFHALTIDAQL